MKKRVYCPPRLGLLGRPPPFPVRCRPPSPPLASPKPLPTGKGETRPHPYPFRKQINPKSPFASKSLSFASKGQSSHLLCLKVNPDDASVGSCLKTGQHFIFVIIYLLLPINCIILDSVSKILFNFFYCHANNNNYDSNNENIAP